MGYVMQANSSALTLRLVWQSSYTKLDIFDHDPSGAQAWSCWERGPGLPKMADFRSKSAIDVHAGLQPVAAGPLTPVPVAAAYNHAFVIPSAVHRAAVLVDNRLPPRPVKTLSLGLRCDTERKASTSSGWAGTT